MTDRGAAAVPSAEPYSPQRRTALVLTGTGTAGAYHAGVLRALHEAGVKLDVVAGRGIGVVGALFAAVDGAQRLWDDKGFWRAPAVAVAVPLAADAARSSSGRSALSLAIVAVPLAVDGARPDRLSDRFRAEDGRRRRRGGPGRRVPAARAERRSRPRRCRPGCRGWCCWCSARAARVAASARWLAQRTRAAARAVLVAARAARRCRRAARVEHCWRVMWDLRARRGAAEAAGAARAGAPLRRAAGRESRPAGLPRAADRRARRRRASRPRVRAGRARRGGAIWSGGRRAKRPRRGAPRSSIWPASARDHLADAVAGGADACRSPPTGTRSPSRRTRYWRGETHRLCDRPAALIAAARRADRPRRRADRPRVGGAGIAGPARAGGAAPRRPRPARRVPAVVRSRGRPRRDARRPRRASAHLHDPAGAQSDRPVRFRRRLRRSLRSAPAARRADEPRLRRRLPSVHRAGRRRQRRTGRSSVTKSNVRSQKSEVRSEPMKGPATELIHAGEVDRGDAGAADDADLRDDDVRVRQRARKSSPTTKADRRSTSTRATRTRRSSAWSRSSRRSIGAEAALLFSSGRARRRRS